MAYRMEEITGNVRAGKRSDGALVLEVWAVPRGWVPGAYLGPMEEIIIPADAVERLFDFLR